jgi:methylphosphotriester-DNA--protein-cysteine methyltransferase
MGYTLLDTDRHSYVSATPGRFGGHRKTRVYGRLDCRAARCALDAGGYVTNRVFFADDATAVAAGYRPCAVCLPEDYQAWKSAQMITKPVKGPPVTDHRWTLE